MVSGQHNNLPSAELRSLTDDLQLQAAADSVTITIGTQANVDGTVNVTWTVAPAAGAVTPPVLVDKPATTPMPEQATVTPPTTSLLGSIKLNLVVAAKTCSVDVNLLGGIAYAESSLRPDAKSSTSSAYGLFQFIDSTWDAMVADYGTELGVTTAARSDIRAQCLMGAAAVRDYVKELTREIGRLPTDAECYAAHFLGTDTAATFLTGDWSRPADVALGVNAQKITSANSTIFFDHGVIRSVAQVLSILGNRISSAILHAEAVLSLSPGLSTSGPMPATPPADTGGDTSFGVGNDWLRPAMVAAIQKQLSGLTGQNPGASVAVQVYYAALACENVLVCPFHDLHDGHLACAYAVNRVVQFATGEPVDGSIGTDGLYASLPKKADVVNVPQPGAIVISPTQGDIPGHVGIVGEGDKIYSNSSNIATLGVFRQNYTVASWEADLGQSRGLPIYYFVLR